MKNGELAFRKREFSGLWKKLVEKSYIMNHFYSLYRTGRARKLTEVIFRNLEKDCEKNNIKLLIVRIPLRRDLACDDWKCRAELKRGSFENVLNKKETTYIELADYVKRSGQQDYRQFYLPNSGHLGERGTEFAANVTARILAEQSTFV